MLQVWTTRTRLQKSNPLFDRRVDDVGIVLKWRDPQQPIMIRWLFLGLDAEPLALGIKIGHMLRMKFDSSRDRTMARVHCTGQIVKLVTGGPD